MSERILTLFGEEVVPQQTPQPPKGRPKKKTDEKKEPDNLLLESEPASQEPTEQPPMPVTIAAIEQNTVAAFAGKAAGVPVVSSRDDSNTEVILAQPNPDAATEATPSDPLADTLPEDWNGEKQYYAIGEVATLLKVKTSNVRFWTTEFKMKVRTNRKGDRLYTVAQVKELKTIYNLVKERGFTLNGAKTRLKAPNNKEVETVDLKTQLKDLRGRLVAIKNQLK